ncbi:MAG TPA: hypothetical protein VMM13_15645 [Euzebya sp.]|nr:hypothetical protein [Euzebya sp.]
MPRRSGNRDVTDPTPSVSLPSRSASGAMIGGTAALSADVEADVTTAFGL